MKMRIRVFALLAGLGVLATMSGKGAFAADAWPTNPITIVVATRPGGGFDLMARTLAPALSKELGVPVVVMNKPGGSMLLGSAYALSQPHDGNTLLCAGPAPYWYADINRFHAPFKLSDFDILNIEWADRSGIFVPASSHITSLKELLAAIKAHPGKLSAGAVRDSGEFYNLGILRKSLGLPPSAVRVVTYGASAPLRSALAGGQLDFAVVSLDASIQMLSLMKPLAVFGSPLQPSRSLPVTLTRLPTVSSVLKGFGSSNPDFVPSSLRAIIAPADFKQHYPDRYKKLLAAYQKVVQNPQFIADSAKKGIAVQWEGPAKSLAEVEQAFTVFNKYKDLVSQP